MYFIYELLELIERRSLFVELGKGGVNIEQIHNGERTAEASHARVGGRSWVDRKQLHDATTERADNKVELLDEIAEFAGPRNDGIASLIKLLDGGLFLRGDRTLVF